MATRRVAAKKTRSVRAETFGSREAFKKSTKKGAGSEALGKMAYIPEEPIIVRFLQEPEDWIGYYEHYMGSTADIRYLPCTEGDCCEEADGNPSYRYLANALIVDDRKGGEVKALKIPKGLGESLGKMAAKFGTLLDRDYELSREGEGLGTSYMAVPEAPSRLNLARYKGKMYDLLDLLEELASGSTGDDDDIDAELKKEARRQGRRYEDLDDEKPSRSKSRGRPTKTRDEDVWDDEDDEDDMDDDEGEAFSPKRRVAPKKTAKKTVARKTTSTARRTIKRR
jgi:hypothetical protein